jgi:nicotinamide mononucleotide transporter
VTWLNDLLWWNVFMIAGTPVALVEVIGFVTGAWCVWLVGRQNPWNWPIGLIQVIAYLFLFWESGLYGDSLLQGVYLVLGLWGWWNWVRGRPGKAELTIRRTRRDEWLWLGMVGLVGTGVIGWWLTTFTASTVPIADSITTVLSLLATYGQARKLLESWWLWIVADLIYIPLYVSKDLNLTAVLYSVFLVLCVIGLRRWRSDLAASTFDAQVFVA